MKLLEQIKKQITGDWIFHAAVLIHILPLFYFKYLYTVNGPEFTYAATIIKNWLINSQFRDVYSLNWFPYSGSGLYWVAAILNFFTQPFVAEKIIQAFSIIFLGYGFRHYLRTNGANHPAFQYLIFPFIYSLIFFQGLYGLCIGTGLSFFVLSENNAFSTKSLILITLVYLSDRLAFWNLELLLFFQWFYKEKANRTIGSTRTIMFSSVLLISSIFLSSSGPSYQPGLKSSFFENLTSIFKLAPLISFNSTTEIKTVLFIGLLTTMLAISSFLKKQNHRIIKKGILPLALFILVISISPPVAAGYQDFTYCLIWIFMLDLLLGLNKTQLTSFLHIAIPPLFFLLSAFHFSQQINNLEARENELLKIKLIADEIPPNKKIASFYYSSNEWDSKILFGLSYWSKTIDVNQLPKGPIKFSEQQLATRNKNKIADDCLDVINYEETARDTVQYILIRNFNPITQNECQNATTYLVRNNYDVISKASGQPNMIFKKGERFSKEFTLKNTIHIDFENMKGADSSKAHSGLFAAVIDEKHPFSLGYNSFIKNLPEQGWIKAEAYVNIEEKDSKPVLVLSVDHKGVTTRYVKEELAKSSGEWTKLSVMCKLPKGISAYDEVKAYVWQPGTGKIWVDDLKINVYSK